MNEPCVPGTDPGQWAAWQRRDIGVHDGVAHRSQAREAFLLRATRRRVSATAV